MGKTLLRFCMQLKWVHASGAVNIKSPHIVAYVCRWKSENTYQTLKTDGMIIYSD